MAISPQDYVKSTQTMSVNDYLTGTPILSVQDYLKYGSEQLVPKVPEVPGASPVDAALNYLTQGGLGFAEMASFGLINPSEDLSPTGAGEAIARGVGNLAGLAVGPLKVGGALAGRAAKLAEPAMMAGLGPKGAKIGANLIRHSGSLGIAEGLVAAGKGEDIEKAVSQGALMGATFGVTQLINPRNKIIGQLARQFGGRALLALTGQTEYETALQQPNIAQTVWHEILNTFFFRNGISLEEVATGKFKSPKKQAMVDALTDAVNDHNAQTERTFKAGREYDIRDLSKATVKEVELKDVYIDEKALDEKAVAMYEDSLSRDPNLKGVRLDWDPELGKYVSNNNNRLLAYLNLVFEVKKMDQDTTPIKFNVLVGVDKGGVPPKLATPAQMALKFLSKDYGTKLTEGLVKEADYPTEMRYVVVDARLLGKKGHKGGAARVLPGSGRGEISLKPHQLLVEVDTNGNAKVVAGGSLMAKYVRLTKEGGPSVSLPLQSAPERSGMLQLADEIEALETKLNTLEPGNVTEPDIRKQLELKKGEAHAKGLERIPEARMMSAVDTKFETKAGMKFDITQAEKQAAKVIGELRKFPLMTAPADYLKGVERELVRMDIPLETKQFLKAIGAVGDDGKLVLAKMREVDSVMEDLQKMETGRDRLQFITDLLLKDRVIKKRPTRLMLTPDMKYDQDVIERGLKESIKATWAEAKKAAAEDPMGGSALQRMLTIGKMRAIMDFRLAALDIEEKTGIPLFTIHEHLSEMRGMKYTEQKGYENRLLPFVRTDPKTQLLIRKYYLSRYMTTDEWVDIYRNKLDDAGRSLIDTLDGVFKDMEPDIINYRFKVWYDQNVVPRRMGLKPKDAKVFKNQDDPEVQALLNEGSVAFTLAKTRGDAAMWDAWIEKARAARLGLVENGNYLPLEILGIKPGNIERNNLLWHIDAAGRGRFLSRGDINGKNQDAIIEGFGHDRNLILSVKNYVSQVLNVKYLDEGLQALNDIVGAFPEMGRAKRRGFLRSTPESRAFTTEEYLKLYAMRLKGYPVKMSMFESMLKDVQLTFFRSLVVRPILWMRNLAQSVVNYPSKKFLDPRFTKFRFEKLPEGVRDWLVDRGIDDSDAFAHAFLELETSLRLAKIPIIGKIWDFAGKFGTGYAKTDTWNRKFVYTTSWFRAKFYMDAYKEGRIDYEKLRNSLDLDKLKPREVLRIKDELSRGNTEEAAFQLAKWMTDNSQWKYSRHERGLDEMTGGGEALSNLLTWSKSMAQHVALMGNRFVDAAKRYKYADDPYAKRAATRQMLHASSDVAGIMIAGAVTNGIYEAFTLGHMGKYSPYGADMFTWQFGGVTGQILSEITAKSSALVSSFDGTAEEKARALDDWIKMADKIGVRQMMPFMKQTLAVIESLTSRSFISPLYTLQSKFSSGYWRGLEKVDRTFLEGITHALFATDPNKSEDVRRYTYMKLQELRDRSITSTGVAKEWYELQVKRYEYLNDLFMRYQPIDVFRAAEEAEAKRDVQSSIEKYKKERYSMEKKRYRNEF